MITKTKSAEYYLMILISLVLYNILNAKVPQINTLDSTNKIIRITNWQITRDNDIRNNPTILPDSQWEKINSEIDLEKYKTGNWIIRTKIVIRDSDNKNIILGVAPRNIISAFELYWDGEKIGQNGTPGKIKQKEKNGVYNFNSILSHEQVSNGEHILTIRVSNHNDYEWNWLFGEVFLGHYEVIIKEIYKDSLHAFFVSGILFISLLFNLFLYFSRKRTEHLIFGLICFFVAMDFLVTQAHLFYVFQTVFVNFKYHFYRFNTLFFAILFPIYFIISFNLPKKQIWIVLAVNIFVFLFFINILNLFYLFSLIVLILSSVIIIQALILKRQGSYIITAGLVLSWIAFIFNFAFEGLATVMVVCTSFSIAQQFAGKEKSEKEAQLKSAQLEIELLKKNINPHFILNTLTSIIVWLRKDTGSAIKLIESLAEEFRLINQISPLPLIPVKKEIDLCKTHLKIMSLRKGADYKLEIHNVDLEDTIPPLIIHTLIENGITHGYENKFTGLFILQQVRDSKSIKYILSNDGEFEITESGSSTGFGAKYIKTRLEECYPGSWSFTSAKSDTGWESIIEIRHK